MDRGQVIPWDNVGGGKKRALGPGVWMRETKTILKPARANKAGMGKKHTLKSQKGHGIYGISKLYTVE